MSRSVQASIRIRTTPQRVLDSFLQLELLRVWWGVERALIEPRSGGVYSLAWDISKAGFKYISSGIIASYQPHQHLHIESLVYFNPERQLLGPMNLKIDMETERDETQLHLVQDGYQTGADWDWYYVSVHEAWPAVLQNLKGFLETSPAG
jgi:uncharacterized protein YndB with AHSA1/START domain